MSGNPSHAPASLRIRFVCCLLLLAAALAGCRGSRGTDSGAVGTITRLADLVEQAVAGGQPEAVSGSSPLHAGDALRVTQGGEGLLDFGDQLRLRLFNDSLLGVTAASEPGAPLSARLFLEQGGFTGQLAESGGEAVFETPGGAQVLVQGTEFMLAYDPQTGISTAGNFSGTVWVQAGGELLQLNPGWWVDVEDDDLDEPRRLPFDRQTYEQLARQLGSPLLPLR